jgi:Tfp pilus assembly protein PilO
MSFIREKPIEVSLVCLIILGLIFYFGLKPLLNNLHSTNLDVKVKKEELSLKQQKLDNLNSMRAKINVLKDSLLLMKKALPKEEDVPDILVQTEALASQSGLLVSSFTPSAKAGQAGSEVTEGVPQTVSQQTGVNSVSYGIALTGGYPSLLSFLENVEKNLRPTTVKSVTISGGSRDKPLSINLNMISFYQSK